MFDLSKFIGKKEKPVTFYFRPMNSEIFLLKLSALVTIRPSNSKETTFKKFDLMEGLDTAEKIEVSKLS